MLIKKKQNMTQKLCHQCSQSPSSTDQIYKEFEIGSDKNGWAMNFQQLSFNENVVMAYIFASVQH